MGIRIGDLDRRISIETNTPTGDEYGGETVLSWAKITSGDVWAKIEQGRGRQTFITDEELTQKTTVFKIRYRDDFDEEDRIIYQGDAYGIQVIREIGRHDALFVAAERLGPKSQS